MFRGLDWLVAEAAARGLRLLPVLTNYWQEYGGMRCYVRWACAQRGQQVLLGLCRLGDYVGSVLQHRRVEPLLQRGAAPKARPDQRRAVPAALPAPPPHLVQPPTGEGEAAEPFYSDPDCQRMFHAALHALVHRTNSLTGRMYRRGPPLEP